jgi:hypothetical protein
MNTASKTLMLALMVLVFACTSHAQDDSKIKVKITKQIDGETKTFEREYANAEEMNNDPEYQKFSGSDKGMTFTFRGPRDMQRHIEIFGDGDKTFSWKFDSDEFDGHMDKVREHMKEFRMHKGPGVYMFGDEGDIHIYRRDFEGKEEELQKKLKELEEKMKGLDKDIQEEIRKSLESLEETYQSMGAPRKIHRGGLSVTDVNEGDFGKKGVVSKSEQLELTDVNFAVMHKRLQMQFRVAQKGELQVKITNSAGKEIYNRYFENYDGRFSDSIDFGKYSPGKYLLEINQGKKRYTRKIEISE